MMVHSAQQAVKIPFDSLTLRAVVEELREHLLGGQIQDVRQPAPTELRLGIRSHNRNFLLALSADPRFARVHLTATRSPNLPTPPSFCTMVRKHAEGGIIRDVRQNAFDRIFEMEIETRDDLGERETVTLIAELMGKHSNLILVSAKGTILDSAKRVSSRINRLRETLPGLPYQAPPSQDDRLDPFDNDTVPLLLAEITEPEPTALTDLLLSRVAGMSPFLAKELTARILASLPTTPSGYSRDSQHLKIVLNTVWDTIFGETARQNFAPTLLRDANKRPSGAYPFPTLQASSAQQEEAPSLNLALDETFSATVERAGLDAVTGELRGKIDQERRRLEKRLQACARAIREANQADGHQQTGELILANLWRIEPGKTAVIVQDYYDPALPDRTLTLDAKLSPQENAESFFRRARKARDSAASASEQLAALEETLLQLEEAKTRLESLDNAEQVRQLRTSLLNSGLLRESSEEGHDKGTGKTGPDFQGHKIRRFTTLDGYEILIGETATANDFLTTRLASPNDIWLHVRAAASSHVIIRTHGKPEEVPQRVLLQAAENCAKHSVQKHSSLVAVDYTLKKYVRKPRGSAPGSADYQREKTLEVSPEL